MRKVAEDKRYKIPFLKTARKHWMLLVMLAPALLYVIVFSYIPMTGIVLAFKNYQYAGGIYGSPWSGLDNFKALLIAGKLGQVTRNTLLYNIAFLFLGVVFEMGSAILLNELLSKKFKKIAQSFMFLPYFISWVVVAGIATNLFSQQGGTINRILESFGMPSVPFLSDNGWWIFTYVVCNVWKEIGWGTIIYLAALTGVDESLYEAAYLDGATKFQRLVYITLPSIKSVIVTMLILQISKMMTIGLDAPLLLGNDKVKEVSEVISTYTYRLGIERAKYSDSTAIGLFQSVINIIILFAADKFAKAIGEDGII